ncbi:MAG: glycogen debranching enzyme GlgX, partial [Roseicyclus sp.]
AVRQDPVLAGVKLIAEPWDTGPNGYQLGNFPPGWAEWNDRYRDTLRSYWRGDDGALRQVADGILGSSGSFAHDGRRPWASVNLVTAHDGFTLSDLVSYNERHNEANLEGGQDGHSHNLSWNCGVEGPTDDARVLALRARQRRNLMATLLLSQGTPMILMGDERGRSQGGNNNAYCQPGEINWQDWSPSEADAAFEDFVRGVIAIRASRTLFEADRYLHSGPDPRRQRSARWLRPDGAEMTPEDWVNDLTRATGLLLRDGDTLMVLAMNASEAELDFVLPEAATGWTLLVDTMQGIADPDAKAPLKNGRLDLPPRSLILLEAGHAD